MSNWRVGWAGRFGTARSGNYAIIFALSAPIVLGVAGGGLDYVNYGRNASALQAVADGAALGAVSGASLKGWSEAVATAAVKAYVDGHMARIGANGAVYSTKVAVDLKTRRVDVLLEQDNYAYFVASYFKSNPQIAVRAAAQATGQTNVCVIGLDPEAESTISLNSNAVMTAANCAVYSNSTSPVGLESKSNSILSADLTCTAGGYSGGARNFQGEVLTDCPRIDDPLKARTPPKVDGPCKFTNHEVKDKVATVAPGIYCGGLLLDGNAEIKMNPGAYVFRDGPFIVNSNVVVTGAEVALVFTGKNAGFEFKSNVEVDLEAPSSGDMAGLLVYQFVTATAAEFRINSNHTRNLLGTLYMPNGHFIVDANNKVADESAYTAIVARTISLNASPNLVLNTDYGATKVPVPDGLGPSSGAVRLVK